MKRAQLARFYGFSHEEISEMPQKSVMDYWRAVNVLEARELLTQLRVICHPHHKRPEQKKFSDHLFKNAYPEFREVKTISSEMFAKIAATKMGRG